MRPNPAPATQGAKLATYESGEEAIRTAWFNFNPRFYLVALVFLIFDVEIAFIFPVAAVFKRWVTDGHGGRALLELFGFVAVLLLGLAYVWKKGDLEWIRTLDGARPAGVALPVTRSRAAEHVGAPMSDEATPSSPSALARSRTATTTTTAAC